MIMPGHDRRWACAIGRSTTPGEAEDRAEVMSLSEQVEGSVRALHVGAGS